MSDASQTNGRAIEVEGLVKQFKKGPRAVDGIDLHVDAGEIYGFLGPNGAGKSTTVLMLTTLLPLTEGRASVGGFDVKTQGGQVREQIGAALQEAALDPHLTAREHMRLQTALHGVPKAERMARGDELIERVGLSEAAERRVGGYSGGMRRRLDLALALVHAPRLLFLDEPTTGLDPQSRSSLWEEVERLTSEEGITVFLTTQYLEEADRLADRVGIIDRGKIAAEGTPQQLKAEIGEPAVEATPADPADRARLVEVMCRFSEGGMQLDTVGEAVSVRLAPGHNGLQGVLRELDAAGIELADLQLHQPTLDDVFLDKTGRKLEGAGEGPEVEQTTAEREAVPA
jgi:ABC-2 type transport system ATP-binding protein